MEERCKQKYIDGVLYKLCACGICGLYFIAGKNCWGVEKRFLNGHNRGAKSKHFIRTPEQIIKNKEAQNKPATKKKQSESHIKWYADPENKKKFILAQNTTEAIKKHKEAIQKFYAVPENRKKRKEVMNRPEVKEKLRAYRGENHWNWQGGISDSPYPQDWTEDLRDSIRKRDGYKCQVCGKEQKEFTGWHKRLAVHHIDYDKNHCSPENLITLCNPCNVIVNYEREKWKVYFNEKQINNNFGNNNSILYSAPCICNG